MRNIFLVATFAAALVATPAFAQSEAYPTPDNNLSRSDDVDQSEAPYLNEEFGAPSSYALPPADDGIVVDYGNEGAGSGESGDDSEQAPDALPPPR